MSKEVKFQYRTAESVSPGHPDKLCDQISDAILDAYLTEDPDARVAVDVAGGHGMVFVTGEVTSRARHVDVKGIVHRLAGKNLEVTQHLAKQSSEIAQGVDTGGAGDQGIMIGYATAETPEMLPLEVVLSRRLNQFIYKKFPFDGKTQVTLRDGQIDSIVASFQNAPQAELKQLVKEFFESCHPEPTTNLVIPSAAEGSSNNCHPELVSGSSELKENDRTRKIPKPQHQTRRCWARQVRNDKNWDFSKYFNPKATKILANPAGDWQQGGFDSDAGLTGRKLAVDNYGPRIAVGGGCFSGKDPSKVDRSAAYMARKIAVDYLRERQAKEVFVRLAYAIGVAEPLEKSVIVDGQHEIIADRYNLTPHGIIKTLNLKRPIYEPTARYGHFGEGFGWDSTP